MESVGGGWVLWLLLFTTLPPTSVGARHKVLFPAKPGKVGMATASLKEGKPKGANQHRVVQVDS